MSTTETSQAPTKRSRPFLLTGEGWPYLLVPLIPVADIAEVLAEGDRAALEADFDPRMEPVPSAFFDDLDPLPRQR